MIIGFGQDVRPKGRVPEWSNGVLSKSIERAIVPGVRIPPLPPYFFINDLRLLHVNVTPFPLMTINVRIVLVIQKKLQFTVIEITNGGRHPTPEMDFFSDYNNL